MPYTTECKDSKFSHEMTKYIMCLNEYKHINSIFEETKKYIYNLCKNIYIDVFKSTGNNPKSITINALSSSSITIINNDKYNDLDKKKIPYLRYKYGYEILKEHPKYVMDEELLNKYSYVINKMIKDSKDILEEDKLKLMYSTVTYTLDNDILDKFLQFSKNKNIDEFINDINPIFELINPMLYEKKVE
jgi:hypothetical protein